MTLGNAFFFVIGALIKPVLSALQRPCVEIQTIHHDKILKAIVYFLFVLKQSFQRSSSCYCLCLVWLCFLTALSGTCPLTFPRDINLIEWHFHKILASPNSKT